MSRGAMPVGAIQSWDRSVHARSFTSTWMRSTRRSNSETIQPLGASQSLLGASCTRGKPTLVQCAWAAARKKSSYFQAQFLRLKARHGAKKAAVAVAASILRTVYHMLGDGTWYRDLGPQHFARRDPDKAAARLANRIRNLGYHVEIRPAA